MYSIGYGVTDMGRVRNGNQEALFVDDGLGLYVVSDGMGGHAAGAVASATAVEAAVRYVRERRGDLDRAQHDKATLAVLFETASNAIQQASDVVYSLATSSPDKAGMGCTLTLLLVKGRKAAMGHVGDSRLYLKRDSQVHLMSVDHTYAVDLARMGVIGADEIRTNRFAHVLSRSVGTQQAVQPDVLVFDVLPGDCFLLCSDGLSDYITEPNVQLQSLGTDDVDVIAQNLVSFANDAGGQDDITAVVVTISDDADAVTAQLANNINLKFRALEHVFLFEGLSLAQLQRVLNIAQVESYPSEDVIVKEGQTWSSLCVLLDGELKVFRGHKTASMMQPKDAFGATTLLRPRPARATLKASKPSLLLRIEQQPFLRLVRTRPWLGVELLQRLGVRLSVDLDEATIARTSKDGETPSEASGIF